MVNESSLRWVWSRLIPSVKTEPITLALDVNMLWMSAGCIMYTQHSFYLMWEASQWPAPSDGCSMLVRPIDDECSVIRRILYPTIVELP